MEQDEVSTERFDEVMTPCSRNAVGFEAEWKTDET